MRGHPDITDLVALASGEIAAELAPPSTALQGVLRALMLEAMDRAAAAVYDAPTQPDITAPHQPTQPFKGAPPDDGCG